MRHVFPKSRLLKDVKGILSLMLNEPTALSLNYINGTKTTSLKSNKADDSGPSLRYIVGIGINKFRAYDFPPHNRPS